jgi:hypothetical protein
MARDSGSDLHAQIFELLMDKVRNDTYPSTTMLNMIEEILKDDDVEEYTSALIEKVTQDTYPSIDHLRRLLAFA